MCIRRLVYSIMISSPLTATFEGSCLHLDRILLTLHRGQRYAYLSLITTFQPFHLGLCISLAYTFLVISTPSDSFLRLLLLGVGISSRTELTDRRLLRDSTISFRMGASKLEFRVGLYVMFELLLHLISPRSGVV